MVVTRLCVFCKLYLGVWCRCRVVREWGVIRVGVLLISMKKRKMNKGVEWYVRKCIEVVREFLVG